jgi:hypothetical protein
MTAGLCRFGSDFGQGERDRRFFQLDDERPRYLADKRAAPPDRRVLGDADPRAAEARAAACAWIKATLAREAPRVLADSARDRDARDELDALARALQEDLCVMCGGPDRAGSAALIDVRFPSGWRPERLRDASFRDIHAPVPGFAKTDDVAASMVRSMVERGPFVRFVWTLTPDDRLDRHPDAPGRSDWSATDHAFLRVERQVTLPLRAADASLFLIRVYHYPLLELTPAQQLIVLEAMARMPREIRAYKGLPRAARIAELLDLELPRLNAAEG